VLLVDTLFTLLLLAMNFAISWHNAVAVGRMWSESKVIGGSMRILAVAGYIMTVVGFTMVYGYILLIIAPFVIPLFLPDVNVNVLVSLADDMLYVLAATFIIPSGIIIWFHSAVRFWRERTLGSGLTFGWNTYAQIRNSVNAARHLPSAIGRIAKALFGSSGRGAGRRKKGDSMVILAALFIVIVALCGGWLTASSLLKKADREYDGLAEFEPAA
jgi:hypothetical protein